MGHDQLGGGDNVLYTEGAGDGHDRYMCDGLSRVTRVTGTHVTTDQVNQNTYCHVTTGHAADFSAPCGRL